ncbi:MULTISPECIES: hypothetical protein [unclassified Oceanobacter]|uniref:hypothetical protein n=1 Tax=unclassified Oceanobacter TaxID=2620260 RepID=UPI0027373FBB|nr:MULTISPECIES: hypothetical protein [unclassified Oceanobacter]MDP2608286.1 hypothetical protein [Oceanobacter sp. 1_MG-2023]MDP2612171.1 hypothetical protein [Oceanobacter sp. 2_MG-2023]
MTKDIPVNAEALDSSSHYLLQLEGKLRAAVELRPTRLTDNWLLLVHLFYDGDTAGTTSFNLHGYSREEAEALAANLQDNAYLMKEIDEYLWGESD